MELQALIECGWVRKQSGRWGVEIELQEQVARYAWRHDQLPAMEFVEESKTRQFATRELRKALYCGKEDLFLSWDRFLWQHQFEHHPLDQLWRPFDPQWLHWLAPKIRNAMVAHRLLSGTPLKSEELSTITELVMKTPLDYEPRAVVELAFKSLLAGRLELGERLVNQLDQPAALACQAFALMQRGLASQAVARYKLARAELRKATGRRNIGFGGSYGLLELLALLETGDLAEAEKWLTTAPDLHVLKQIVGLAQREDQSNRLPVWQPRTGLPGLLCALLHTWCDRPPNPDWTAEARHLDQQDQRWLAAEYQSLLGNEKLHQELGTRSLRQAIQAQAPWKLALEALRKLVPGEAPPPAPHHDLRLIWKVDVYRSGSSLGIDPFEQKRNKNGWTAGRPVALKRLFQEHAGMIHLSPADRGICRALRSERVGYYGETHYSFDHQAAAPYLVGHPLVFLHGTEQPLKVKKVRPHVRIEATGGCWRVTLEKPPAYTLRAGCLEILQLNSCELCLQTILDQSLNVPPEGQPELYQLLQQLSSQIQVDLPEDPDQSLVEELRRALG